MPIPDFKPGDLIDVVALRAYFVEIDARLLALEQDTSQNQGQVIVAALIPALADGIRIGQELRIIGANFYFTRGAARVFLNGTERVIKSATSSDTELRIDIPLGTPTGNATLQVTNSFTSVTQTITILTALTPLLGDINVRFTGVTPTHMQTDSANTLVYVFAYEIDTSDMTRLSTYVVSPVISESAWQDSIRIVNITGAGGERSSEFRLDLKQKAQFGVRVELKSTPAHTTAFTLRIDVAAEGRNWSQADRKFRNGEDVLPPNLAINLNTATITPPESFNDATNTITVTAAMQRSHLVRQIEFSQNGDYTLVAAPTDPAVALASMGWSINPDVTKQTVNVLGLNAGDKHPESMSLYFIRNTGAPAPQSVEIEVGYKTAASKTVEIFTLKPQ